MRRRVCRLVDSRLGNGESSGWWFNSGPFLAGERVTVALLGSMEDIMAISINHRMCSSIDGTTSCNGGLIHNTLWKQKRSDGESCDFACIVFRVRVRYSASFLHQLLSIFCKHPPAAMSFPMSCKRTSAKFCSLWNDNCGERYPT